MDASSISLLRIHHSLAMLDSFEIAFVLFRIWTKVPSSYDY